jgi:hypothetical protein
MGKLFGRKRGGRGRHPEKRGPNNIEVESQLQTAKARSGQPITLVQFFRESPFVGVELDLERQKDQGHEVKL